MKIKFKPIVLCFLSICIMFGFFAATPVITRAESVLLDQAAFNALIEEGEILLTGGNTYQLASDINVNENVEIKTNGVAYIDLNEYKITVPSEKSLAIRNGVTVTGAVYGGDTSAVEVFGTLNVKGGSIDVSGSSATAIKVAPGGLAALLSANTNAPGIGVHVNGGELVVNDNTIITANEETGTGIKVDNSGTAVLFAFGDIDAAEDFDVAGDGSKIYNFYGMVKLYNQDGSEFDFSESVAPGTSLELRYSDGKAEDAQGIPVYYTTDGTMPGPENESSIILDNTNQSDDLIINENITIRTAIYMEEWQVKLNELASMQISVTEALDLQGFIDEFNDIKDDGGTIQLMGNLHIDEDTSLEAGGDVDIDLNGYKITVPSEKLLEIKSGVTVTGLVNEDDRQAVDVFGTLNVKGGSIDVSGSSATAIKVGPDGLANLLSADINAPGIGVHVNGGELFVNDDTMITADEGTGTGIKVDNNGTAVLFAFRDIGAAEDFDVAGDDSKIYNFYGMVTFYNQDGSEFDFSGQVASGTVLELRYSDSKAMDAQGIPIYCTTDRTIPGPGNESSIILDNNSESVELIINETINIKAAISMEEWEPQINELFDIRILVREEEEPQHDFQQFMDQFNNIRETGGTINLEGNLYIGEDTILYSPEDVTINTGEYRIVVDGEGNDKMLTLKGRIRITGNGYNQVKQTADGVVLLQDRGYLEMLGGIIEATVSGGASVYAEHEGKLALIGHDAVISSNAENGTGVFLGTGGNANITGGNITANTNSGIGIKVDGGYAAAVISGGEIIAKTPKFKGNTVEHPEKIYDFRGIIINTEPPIGYVPEGTQVTISVSEAVAGSELDPMDAAGAAVYYTTEDYKLDELEEWNIITGKTETIELYERRTTINVVAIKDDGFGTNLNGPVWKIPYFVWSDQSIDEVIGKLTDFPAYSWAYDAIEKLYRNFIMPDFWPEVKWLEDEVLRKELAELIAASFKLPYYSNVGISFEDDIEWALDNNQGCVPYIEAAKDCFISPENTFYPEGMVTREHAIYSIIKVLGLNTENLDDDILDEAAEKYEKDWAQVDDRCKPYIALATKMGIVSGFNGYFKPGEPVTNPEMAVLLYRALVFSGGVGGGIFTDMKPGDYGYEAAMDLANRAGEYFEGITEFNPKGMIDSGTWDAWKDALGVELAYPGDDTTNRVDAAILLIAELPADVKTTGQVFSDVAPVDWYYDGVMNLYNLGIIKGFEDGTFRPDEVLSVNSLALFIAGQEDIDVIDWQTAENQDDIRAYFPGNTSSNTREAAGYAILKLCDVDISGMDPDSADAILERFADKEDVSYACKPALAYLISIGALKGDENGNLYPQETLTRGQFAVFYSRVINGLDKSKMKDYLDTIEAAE